MFHIYADAMMVATRMDASEAGQSESRKHAGAGAWVRLAADAWAQRLRTKGLTFLGLL